MADTWPVVGPIDGQKFPEGELDKGAGGFLSGIGSALESIGKGMGAGIGGRDPDEAPAKVKPSGVVPGIVDRVRDAAASLPSLPSLPGAGDLWTYDSKGLGVTRKGWLVVGAVAVGAYMMMGRR